MKFRVGDSVKIVSGKDKGKTGKIEKVYPKNQKALVEGVNQYKRHLKREQGKKGEIVTITKPLPVANFMLICPKCNKLTRIAFKVEKNGKIRICRKCGKIV